MAVLAAILPIVSRSSALSLESYRLIASEPNTAKDFLKTAKSISGLALIVKQVGTIIKEDDRLPSAEAIETLEDILDQCTAILTEVETIVSQHRHDRRHDVEHSERNGGTRLNSEAVARLDYLAVHLDSLRLTSSVMLQTLYTAQSIMWARVRPTVSPDQCAIAVANEKYQLETLIIEQQMSILLATKIYEPSRPDARLLMEYDSTQSLVTIEHGIPQPADLFKYQDRFITSLDTYSSDEEHWLSSVCGVSRTQLDRLLDRWTRLRQFEDGLQADERKVQAQKRETQQPTVESDSEDEVGALPRFAGNGVRLNTPTPHRPGSVQPLFTETATLPIPVRDFKFGPTAPLSPASSYGGSPRFSGSSLPVPSSPGSAPVSPRTSVSTLPAEAAAAVDAKRADDDTELEIPWMLRTRRHWWKFIDGKIRDANTEASSSEAFSDRHSRTEVLASWVCKEAIKEAGYPFAQVQKDRHDGKRTKLETCFCIEQALTFNEVRRLVERTVQIYRETQPPSPRPRMREEQGRSSIDSHLGSTSSSTTLDRDKTPLAKQIRHPPLERSTTAYPPPPPPPLDRSNSMPGQVPTYPGSSRISGLHVQPSIVAAATNQIAPYSPHGAPILPSSSAAQMAYTPQGAPYSPQPFYTSSPTYFAPHPALLNSPFPQHNVDPRLLQPTAYPQSPRHSSSLRNEHYSSASGTSDSDGPAKERKHRSRSRRRSDSSHYKKKGHEHNAAKSALLGVAGLTALLDGLVGI